jgi:glutaminyl-peptide cyclotransferase
MLKILTLFSFLFLCSCNNSETKKIEIAQNRTNEISTNQNIATEDTNVKNKNKNARYEIVRTFPHDKNAYTQGLYYHEGTLYESTGGYGESTIRKVNPISGQVIKRRDIPNRYFGEGITILNNKLYFLTWLEKTCKLINMETLETEKTFSYFGEGWGLTDDGQMLIKSDGTNNLSFIDPDDFSIIKTVSVFDGRSPVRYLNELEYVNGYVYANVWQLDKIAIIDPLSGNLKYWLDLSELRSYVMHNPDAEVLNGIAYIPDTDTFIVTGKNWDYYFEIKIFLD